MALPSSLSSIKLLGTDLYEKAGDLLNCHRKKRRKREGKTHTNRFYTITPRLYYWGRKIHESRSKGRVRTEIIGRFLGSDRRHNEGTLSEIDFGEEKETEKLGENRGEICRGRHYSLDSTGNEEGRSYIHSEKYSLEGKKKRKRGESPYSLSRRGESSNESNKKRNNRTSPTPSPSIAKQKTGRGRKEDGYGVSPGSWPSEEESKKGI